MEQNIENLKKIIINNTNLILDKFHNNELMLVVSFSMLISLIAIFFLNNKFIRLVAIKDNYNKKYFLFLFLRELQGYIIVAIIFYLFGMHSNEIYKALIPYIPFKISFNFFNIVLAIFSVLLFINYLYNFAKTLLNMQPKMTRSLLFINYPIIKSDNVLTMFKEKIQDDTEYHLKDTVSEIEKHFGIKIKD